MTIMMDLQSNPVNEILYVSFNQDSTCFVCGTQNGFRVYNTDPFRLVLKRDFENDGSLGVIAMLNRTNILAFSGGGQQRRFEPHKIVLWDDRQTRIMAELKFLFPVKSVRLRKEFVVAVLENKVYVYGFRNLRLLDSIETTKNPKGLCCLAGGNDKVVLVCPGMQQGSVLVISYPLSFGDPHSSSPVAPIERERTLIINAHEANIAAMTTDHSGKFLATASEKGTIIRVFDTEVGGSFFQELRRGADKAEIHSLAFSPNAQWLAASSDKGTIHIFAVSRSSGCRSGTNNEITGSLAIDMPQQQQVGNATSSLKPLSRMLPAYFSSEWSFAQFKVDDCRCIASFGSDETTVIVVCAKGAYYKVRFDKERGGGMIQEDYVQFDDKSGGNTNPVEEPGCSGRLDAAVVAGAANAAVVVTEPPDEVEEEVPIVAEAVADTGSTAITASAASTVTESQHQMGAEIPSPVDSIAETQHQMGAEIPSPKHSVTETQPD